MANNFYLVEHPIIKRDVTILRDKHTDSETFRAALQRVSNILAAEIIQRISRLQKLKLKLRLKKQTEVN